MARRVALVLGLALGASGMAARFNPAWASTFTVDTTADLADPTPGDGTCGSGRGTCSLRAAVQESNKSSFANTIELPAGTYKLTIAGPNEAYAATGDLDLVGTVKISGAGAGSTIVDGGGIDRVFDIAENAEVAINDLTIRGGLIDGGNGGGILNNGRLKLENVTLTGNRAKVDPQNQNGQGGAVRSHTHLSATNVRVTGNTADGRGGGINNSGFMEIMNGAVTDNASLTDDGGGIANDGKLSVVISSVEGNSANDGGGLDNVQGEVRIIDSTFDGNRASAAGGAIRNSGILAIQNSTLSNNRAGTTGGGLSNVDGGTVDLNNATIAGNAAGNGGGGGVASEKPNSMTLGNTIVAGNSAAGGAADCGGTLASRGYNLVQEASGCGFAGSAAGDLSVKDAKLGPLAANGGPTKTRALLPGSPAINAGNPAPPTGKDGTCTEADQRGIKRPQAGSAGAKPACDIGAFELAPAGG